MFSVYSLLNKRKSGLCSPSGDGNIRAIFLGVGKCSSISLLSYSKEDIYAHMTLGLPQETVISKFREKLLLSAKKVVNDRSCNESHFWNQLAMADKPVIFVDNEDDTHETPARRIACEALILAKLLLGHSSSCIIAPEILTRNQIDELRVWSGRLA